MSDTPYGCLQFATEMAYDTLVDQMIKYGLLPKGDNMHLMYNPSQKATQQFIDACHAVIAALGNDIKPEPE